ncbi:2'-5' RNA ligase family protein [Roseobacter sp. OBYS 0001]|uniref:2'-5' RNA ligase family protein n=1 Tax=Roseobacter sp. OBYS 0001 TaxID=882651 RepID=UPI0035B5FBB4
MARYAERFAAPVFEPHLTLLGDVRSAPKATVAACRSLLATLPKSSARISRVSQTADFFMSLFLDLDIESSVASAREDLAARLAIPLPQPFRPHLSLAYGLPAGEPGQQAVHEMSHRFVGKTITLNEIRVVRSAKELAIDEWRAIHIERLK